MAVDITALSKVLNITVRRVNQLVHEGMPREERGKYDLGACMTWYIRYLQKALAKKSTMDESGEVSSLQGSRQELLKIQIEREKFELDKEKSLFLPIELHEKIMADMIQETKARVRAVGARVAPDLIGETSRLMIQAKLDKAHDEALRKLALVVPRLPEEIQEPDEDGSDPTPEPGKPEDSAKKKTHPKPQKGRKPRVVKNAPGKVQKRGK